MPSGPSKVFPRDSRGFTLVELAVALAVVGVMAGAFAGLNSMLKSSKINSIVREVIAIREAADKYIEATGGVDYGVLGGICGGGLTLLVNQGYLPSSLLDPANNPFGVGYRVGTNGSPTQLWVTVGDGEVTNGSVEWDRIRAQLNRAGQTSTTGCPSAIIALLEGQ